MTRKMIVALLAALMICLSVIGVFALDFSAPGSTSEVTSRFLLIEWDADGNEFVMAGQDGTLIIHITGSTPVNFEYAIPISDECDGATSEVRELLFGQTLAEVLDGRNLRVVFEQSEQIEPISVTVLFEAVATGPADLYPEDGYMGIVGGPAPLYPEDGYMDFVTLPGDISGEEFDLIDLNGEIVVNNEILEDAPLPFWAGTGAGTVVMVPLSAVAEALGYDVSWDGVEQSVRIGVAIQLWVDRTEVHFGRMAPIELSAAPVLMGDEIFVPLDFFREVLGQTAYVFEGQVVIETYSDMM